MNKPQARVRVDLSPECSIGPGKVGLLEGIERSGSLSAAARSMGMSYRRAWLLLHSINAAFQEPVAELAVGGKDGGGARLTAFGRRLVQDFRAFEQDVDQLAAQRFEGLRPSGQVAPVRAIARSMQAPAAPGVRTRKKEKAG